MFVAFLDHDSVGRIGWVDVDAADPTRVLAVSEEPALDVGRPGEFDDSGVNPLSAFRYDGRLWLYYVGWQRSVRVPYLLFTGLSPLMNTPQDKSVPYTVVEIVVAIVLSVVVAVISALVVPSPVRGF